MKKCLKILTVAAMAMTGVLALSSCGEEKFKIGIILVGDETEGYTLAHMNGIDRAAEKLGLTKDQIIYQKRIAETDSCSIAANSLIADGCELIISNSYGHQDFMYQVARENTETTFVAATGDYAAISGLSNMKNAFTSVYESRYVSGVVAGMKLKELIEGDRLTDKNKDADGNWKIGYVGAYKYAEVISGFTAFFLGIRSIVENVSLDVQFTSSWFDIDAEAQAAEMLVKSGCVIIGQHADSTGAPAKCETLLTSGDYVCYSVGYNIDMLSVAPHAALTSATNNWEVFYEYAFSAAMKGETLETDWSEGYKTGAVGITSLGTAVAPGTAEAVKSIEDNIEAGTFHVFDTSKFTVDGEVISSHPVDLSYRDWTDGGKVVFQGETVETIKTSGETKYFAESEFRSAPYFDIVIDGVNYLN